MIGSRCKHCTEGIAFLKTTTGGTMPVDLISCAPDDDENTVFDPARHKSHFATCPGATKARKPRKKRAQKDLEARWRRPNHSN